MKKRLFLFIFLIFALFVIPQKTYAEDTQTNFGIKIRAAYVVGETGQTQVKETITITNKKEFIYTPSYSITLTGGDIGNIAVADSDGSIPFTLKEKADGSREIETNFEKRVVGMGKSFTFTISFSTSNFARKNSNTWEVNIPGLTNPASYEDYTATLTVPAAFGAASIIKPPIPRTSSRTLAFTKDQISTSGIFILFGDVEYYKGTFAYHIENLNLFPVRTEIALPPDTNYQEVLIKAIDPKPENVYKDADGNWLATYSLPPHAKKDIQVKAVFKLNAAPKPVTLSLLERQKYTASTTFWETNDSSIKNVAKNLVTPQDIYNYVVKTLTYNYNKVNSNNNNRIGGAKTLTNPKYAVCLEFTDLFVALVRSKGIPARAVEGYAYTQGDKLRPLSLVRDVLHAWPEYYDDNLKTWVMVDPTWGNTTHGMDYFNSLDFEHIAFVIKGMSSTYPVPAGGYKISGSTRDVAIQFADASEFDPVTTSTVLFTAPQLPIPWTTTTGSVRINNNGNTLLQAQKMDIRSSMSNFAYAYSVPEIPPFGYKEIKVDMGVWNPSFSNLLTKRRANVTIAYNTKINSSEFSLGAISILIIVILGGVLFVIIGTVFAITTKARRVPLQK